MAKRLDKLTRKQQSLQGKWQALAADYVAMGKLHDDATTQAIGEYMQSLCEAYHNIEPIEGNYLRHVLAVAVAGYQRATNDTIDDNCRLCGGAYGMPDGCQCHRAICGDDDVSDDDRCGLYAKPYLFVGFDGKQHWGCAGCGATAPNSLPCQCRL